MKTIALLLLSLLLGRVHAELVCELGDPITLDNDGLVSLQYSVNRQEGIFTMKITYTGGQSWIGIGINHEGSSKMTPVTSVIGRMLDGEPSVLKYDLESDAKDGSGVIPMNLQSLMDASFTQDDTTSVLQFTQLLDEETQTVTDESVWVYAVGNANNVWEGKHEIHGAFYLQMVDRCVESAAAPTAAPAPTASPASNTDTTGGDTTTGGGDTNQGGDTTQGDDTDGGDSQDQNVSGAQGGIVQLKSVSDETRSLWVAHGVLMALAWGVCAPLAIGAVLLRNVSFLAKKGCWYKLHFYMNIANILFTFVGFFLAVAAMSKEGEDHFTENTHTKAGLAIFFIALFQFALAFLRPDPPKAPQKQLERAPTDSDTSSPPRQVDHGVSIRGNGEIEVEDESMTDSEAERDPSVKTKTRLAWEISHRFIGMALLGLAWYNCTSGIQLQVDKYDDLGDWQMAAFWGVTAGISGFIFFLAYVVRV